MANSVVVHFAAAKWGELGPWLDEAAQQTAPRRWSYPPDAEAAGSGPSLSLFEYDDALLAYQPQTVDKLLARLPVGPKSTVCLQFVSPTPAAVADAVDLTRLLLGEFSGVAYDGSGRFWSKAEIDAAESLPLAERFLGAVRGAPAAE